jgi:hypothetical protein
MRIRHRSAGAAAKGQAIPHNLLKFQGLDASYGVDAGVKTLSGYPISALT